MVDKFYKETLSSTGVLTQDAITYADWLALLREEEKGENKVVIIAGNPQTGKTTVMNDLVEVFSPYATRIVTGRKNKSETKDGIATFILDYVENKTVLNYLKMRAHVLVFDAPIKPNDYKGIDFPKPSDGKTVFCTLEVSGDTVEEVKLNAIKNYIKIDARSSLQDELVEVTNLFTTRKEIVEGETIYTVTEHLLK